MQDILLFLNKYWIILYLIIYIYMLSVFRRAKTGAWEFIWGSFGFFLIYMIKISDYIKEPVSECITTLTGITGNLTHMYKAYFEHSVIYVKSLVEPALLQIDMECSGTIELGVFLSIILFFNVYNFPEKILYSLIGILYLIFANVIRIMIICVSIYFFGYGIYDVMHSYVGRIIFYVLTVILYFEVFTKRQIRDMKVGDFSYNK